MKEISDAATWNAFIAHKKHSSFLQSYEWGAFQRARGFVVRRLGFGDNALKGAVQAIKNPLLGAYHYWQIPQSPLLDEGCARECFTELTSDHRALFVRIEPQDMIATTPMMRVRDISPSTTLLFDCTRESEMMLASMHPKTRYNIHVAQRKGVVIETAYDERAIELFVGVGERHHFRTQSKDYYKLLMNSFPSCSQEQKKDKAAYSLYCARYRDTLIGAILVMFFGDTATYLFGGSAPIYREVMAPYALQWKAIRDAGLLGYQYYDFWGIAPTDDTHHPWAGITRFKKGFGGTIRALPGTYDFIAHPALYRLYRYARAIRRRMGGAQTT